MVKVLLQDSLRCLRTSRRDVERTHIERMHTNDASLPSTATAHICRVLFSKTRSKLWRYMTLSLDRLTTEATISSGQRRLIRRFSRATEWAPAARWRDSCRAHERL